MRYETLPASTQPDEAPNVQPCHTGKAAWGCAFDAALREQATDTGELAAVTS